MHTLIQYAINIRTATVHSIANEFDFRKLAADMLYMPANHSMKSTWVYLIIFKNSQLGFPRSTS